MAPGKASRKTQAHGGSAADAEAALAALLARIRACRICRDNPRGRPLPHEPRPVLRVAARATICVAGQAPGTRVHASGVPFADPSGDRLRDWMGIDADTFYDARRIAIVPMGFCFPGQDARGADLPPRRECAPAWRDTVFAALPAIRLVVAVGQYAQAYHLGPLAGANLTATVADWRRIVAETGRAGQTIIPLPHPSWRNNAWVKKNPWFAEELLPFLRGEIGRYLAGGSAAH